MFRHVARTVLQRTSNFSSPSPTAGCFKRLTACNKTQLQLPVQRFHNTPCCLCDDVGKDSSLLGKVSRDSLVVGASTSLQKTISPEDVRVFSELTGDWNPIHHQKNKPIVHGALLNGLVSGLIGSKLPGPGSILVKELLRFPNPCYVGDTVTVTVTLTDTNKISTCKFHVVSNVYMPNCVVMEGEAKLLIK